VKRDNRLLVQALGLEEEAMNIELKAGKSLFFKALYLT